MIVLGFYGSWDIGKMIKLSIQKPRVGSKWYRGNFNLGLLIDNHPRFTNIIIALLFIEFAFSWTRE